VTITGSGFAGMRYVTFAGVRAPVVSINHAGTIVVVRAPRSRYAGPVNVAVVSNLGRSKVSNADIYRYVRASGRSAHLRVVGAVT